MNKAIPVIASVVAICFFAFVAFAPQAYAQRVKKDPALALILGVFPGGGYFYLERVEEGLIYLGAVAGLFAFGSILGGIGNIFGVFQLLAFLGAIAIWFYSAYSAFLEASGRFETSFENL
ncbi:MAG: hypothetical protein ACUVXI_17040 [bacterium]